MRVLHTSDWHVGKTVRGRRRTDEHRAVLAEIAGIAADRSVDLVVVAGDLFETSTPTAESVELVYRSLLDLAATAEVMVVAGNHDHAAMLRAVAPLLALGRVHMLTEATRADEGGVRTVLTPAGELDVAMLPFVSRRGLVRADAVMSGDAHENALVYADAMATMLRSLADACHPDRPSLLVAHAFVVGARTGGGERPAFVGDEYAVTTQAFPPTISFVALGHLHRAQKVPGPAPLHYCGSPIQLDFGEAVGTQQVNVVELEAGVPAKVDAVPLTSGRPMLTVTGTLAELREHARALDPEAWVRARVREVARSGLAEEVRDALGDRCVEVLIAGGAGSAGDHPRRRSPHGRTPHDLFVDYLVDSGIEDAAVLALFDELHETATSGVEVES